MEAAAGLEELLARAREAVRALAEAGAANGAGAGASSGSSSTSSLRAKEASRLLRELERAVEYAQRAAAGEAGSESERALALSRLQPTERAARELRAAMRAIVRAEGTAGVMGGMGLKEQLAFLLQRGEGPAGGSSPEKGGQRKGAGKNAAASLVVDAVGESREVTRSLARTRELMAQELRRMGGVVEVIEEDGAALVETHSAHARIGSALHRADALLRRLKRQEQLDRLSKRLAFCLFLTTVAFIVARRVWLPNAAPYVRLARRVAQPLLEVPLAQYRKMQAKGQGEGSVSSPPPLQPEQQAAPPPSSDEEGAEADSLVGRAKEAWRTLNEGLEEIKQQQQQQEEEEEEAAAAEAAAAAAAAAESAAAAEAVAKAAAEQQLQREREQQEQQPAEAAETLAQEEEEEGETAFEIKVEHFQRPPQQQQEQPPAPLEPEEDQAPEAEEWVVVDEAGFPQEPEPQQPHEEL